MNLILATPMGVRLAALLFLGACAGSLVNLGVYRLGWRRRAISPWSRPDTAAPPRRPWDRLPIFGWLTLRREAPLHGPGFWLRPMLVELIAAVGLAALYQWEVGCSGLLPAGFPAAPGVLHCQFLAHAALLALMLAASLIDVDERTIPDAITVPGALLGLLLAAVCPGSLLPDFQVLPNGAPVVDPLLLTAPGDWPAWLGGFPNGASLAIALGCFVAWCAALAPRTWYGRHGWRRALRLSLARLVRSRATYALLVLAVAGSAAITAACYFGDAAVENWQGLLTGLVGLAAGGGLIWLARIIGGAALGREAMGFGDVTLMAMIGAFLGWQTGLIIFFLAPVAGMVLGVAHLLLRRGSEIPYGPFLCLGALATIVAWAPIWDRLQGVFLLGWLVPLTMLGCLVLMGLMLLVWKVVKRTVWPPSKF
jgi:prepilin signal peptidase PulO-like enzyme (type II secretory pathway)